MMSLQYPLDSCEIKMKRFRKLARENFHIGAELSSIHYLVESAWNVESFVGFGTEACGLIENSTVLTYKVNETEWTSSAMSIPGSDFLIWVHHVDGSIKAIDKYLRYHETPSIFSAGYVMDSFEEYQRHCSMIQFECDDDKEKGMEVFGEECTSEDGKFGFSFWTHKRFHGLYLQPRWLAK